MEINLSTSKIIRYEIDATDGRHLEDIVAITIPKYVHGPENEQEYVRQWLYFNVCAKDKIVNIWFGQE